MTREEVNKTSPESEKACKAQYDNAVQAGPDSFIRWASALAYREASRQHEVPVPERTVAQSPPERNQNPVAWR